MKSHKKSFKTLIASLLTVGLLVTSMPIGTMSVEAGKKSKHRNSAVAAHHQNNHHSDSNPTNTDRDDSSRNRNQNTEEEEQKRLWGQFLGEQNEEKGKYFETLPNFVLTLWKKKNVQVIFVDESTAHEEKSLDNSPVHIRKKTTPQGSDVIVTKDHRSFTMRDVKDFLKAVSEFTVDKQAETGTLVTQALVDALNGMKEPKGEQGRALLKFPPSLEDHDGQFDLNFLQDNLSDVKEVVEEAFALFSNSYERASLEIYAQPMWKYMKENVIPVLEESDQNTDTIKQEEREINGKETRFTFVKNAAYLGGASEKYIMRNQSGRLFLFKVTGDSAEDNWRSESEVGANKLLKALGLPGVEIETVTLDIPGIGNNLVGSIQELIELKTKGLYGVDPSTLTDENRVDLQKHQLVDYMIWNGDCHDDNFAIDSNNKVWAIDKGFALDPDEVGPYNLQTDPVLSVSDAVDPYSSKTDTASSGSSSDKYTTPYYAKLWHEWLQNKYDMDFMAVEPFIKKIEDLSDADLRDMFRTYAEGYEKSTGEPANQLLDALIERKHNIRSNVENYYKALAQNKGISFSGFSTTAKSDQNADKDKKEQDDTEQRSTVVNIKDQKWKNRFVTLTAMLGIELDPGTIEGIMKDANSNLLADSLITDYDLTEQYDFEKLEVLAKELDGMLKAYNRQITTPQSEGRYANIADAAEALYREAIAEAVEMYGEASFGGLTPKQSKEKLKNAMLGKYNLTRSEFRELPNKVTIVRDGKAKVIPNAQYTNHIVALTNRELSDQEHGPQIYQEKIQPILDLVGRWKVELQQLEVKKRKTTNVRVLNSISSFLEQNRLVRSIPKNGSIIIATSSYNGQTQAITIGTLFGQRYGIEYTLTAPHNLLADEGTYPGAVNHLVSSVIRHVLDNDQQVTQVSTEPTNPHHVKSSLKLGFHREKQSPPSRLSRKELDDLLKWVRAQHAKK